MTWMSSSLLSSRFGSCWSQIMGTGYLLYWAVEPQTYSLMDVPHEPCPVRECQCASLCLCALYGQCFLKSLEGNCEFVHVGYTRQNGFIQLTNRRLARPLGLCNTEITMTPPLNSNYSFIQFYSFHQSVRLFVIFIISAQLSKVR